MQNSWSLSNLTEFVADSVRNAREGGVPFYHLEFDRVFPSDFYAEMLRTMPDENDYRPMSGKSKVGSSRPDGKPTRTKIDLFPEYIRHLPTEKLEVWDLVGRALRSEKVKKALIQKLRLGLRKRFGENFEFIKERTPAGRVVTPDDIASAVLFLCSADANMIRGQVLLVDGGFSLHAY